MSPDTSEPRVPDIVLERFRLNELPRAESQRLNDRLRHDESLRQRLQALERSDEDIHRLHPPEVFAAGIRRRLDVTTATPPRRVPSWALPAAIAAVTVVLIVAMPRIGPFGVGSTATDPDGDRIKGLLPGLAVYRKTAEGSETLADGAVAHTGDLIRIGYHAAGRQYGVIVSIDGRGGVTLHLPPDGDRAATLDREATVLLDQAYELDDAPRWERFYFVTSDAPFATALVLDAARRAASPQGQPPRELALPRGLEQSTFSLQKEERP